MRFLLCRICHFFFLSLRLFCFSDFEKCWVRCFYSLRQIRHRRFLFEHIRRFSIYPLGQYIHLLMHFLPWLYRLRGQLRQMIMPPLLFLSQNPTSQKMPLFVRVFHDTRFRDMLSHLCQTILAYIQMNRLRMLCVKQEVCFDFRQHKIQYCKHNQKNVHQMLPPMTYNFLPSNRAIHKDGFRLF